MPRNKRYGRVLALTTVVALTGAACTESGISDDGGVGIVTTVSPITNIVLNVACSQAIGYGLVPEGVDSHTFAPRPSDAVWLADTDVVFVNGLSLETPTIRLAESNVREGVEIVELATRTLSEDEYIFDNSFPAAGGVPNPHVWTNPEYAARFAEEIARVLERLNPEAGTFYRDNAAELRARFDQLAEALRIATATVPEENRRLLTYHDSFPYFARDFGWTVIGAIQPSDFSEPSPRDVADLIRQIEESGVPAIFGSEVYPSPVLDQIAAETGATYVDDLRDDDLPGEPGDPQHSLMALLVFDYRTIIEAVGGDASALDEVPTENLCGGNFGYAN